MYPQENHNRLPGSDFEVSGNLAMECSVSAAPLEVNFHFISIFWVLLHWEIGFHTAIKSIVSLCIHLCTDVCCEPGIRHMCSKGSSRWPPISHNAKQIKETIFLLLLNVKVKLHNGWALFCTMKIEFYLIYQSLYRTSLMSHCKETWSCLGYEEKPMTKGLYPYKSTDRQTYSSSIEDFKSRHLTFNFTEEQWLLFK